MQHTHTPEHHKSNRHRQNRIRVIPIWPHTKEYLKLIKNHFHEANIPSIEQKCDLQIAKLAKNPINSKDTPIHNFIKSHKIKNKIYFRN